MRKKRALCRFINIVLLFLFIFNNANIVVARQLSPSDSLSLIKEDLLKQKGTDSTLFSRFAEICIRENNTDLLMNTYREAIDKKGGKYNLSDLSFLYILHDRIDSNHVNENSFYICYYIARIQVKHHTDNIIPASYCMDAIKIATRLHDNCLIVKGYSALSGFYINVKHDLLKTNACLNLIDSVLRVNNLTGITDCGIDVNINYSALYYYLGDNDKGIGYLNKSIAIVKQTGKTSRLYDLYMRRSLLENEEAQYKRALCSLDSAYLSIANIPDNGLLLNNLYADSFNIYVKINDFRRATELQKKISLTKLDVLNDEYYDYLYNLIKLNINDRQYNKAHENINLYTGDLKEWNIQRWKNAYEVKYLLNKAEGNIGSALENYEAYSRYNDSVYHQKQNFAVLAQEIKYENQQKERELNLKISLLQKQGQVDRLYILIMIGFLLMAALIVGTGLVGYKRDKKNIKSLTGLNNEIISQKAALEKSNKEKDRILDVMAHDLRSPVSGIYALSDSLINDDKVHSSMQRPLTIIKNASHSALSLINELLGYRTETLEKISKKPVELLLFIEETIGLLQLKANDKQQKIKAHVPPDPLTVSIDREKMTRVLNNLIGNALKFSHAGATIYVFIEQKDNSVTIAIKDSGIGIPEKLRPELFDMFTTAQRHGTAGEKSYGLGLSISKQMVTLHNGKIWFDSEAGKGTTFYVELPV